MMTAVRAARGSGFGVLCSGFKEVEVEVKVIVSGERGAVIGYLSLDSGTGAEAQFRVHEEV